MPLEGVSNWWWLKGPVIWKQIHRNHINSHRSAGAAMVDGETAMLTGKAVLLTDEMAMLTDEADMLTVRAAMATSRAATEVCPAPPSQQKTARGAGPPPQLGNPWPPSGALSASSWFSISQSPAARGGRTSATPPELCCATPCTPLRLFV